MPSTLAFLATSISLVISKIPFLEPVGMVEVARVDGKWIYHPTLEQTEQSDARIIVAGTKDGICMVEGSANEMGESAFLDVMFTAHAMIKDQVAFQEKIRAEVGVAKEENYEHFPMGEVAHRNRKIHYCRQSAWCLYRR